MDIRKLRRNQVQFTVNPQPVTVNGREKRDRQGRLIYLSGASRPNPRRRGESVVHPDAFQFVIV